MKKYKNIYHINLFKAIVNAFELLCNLIMLSYKVFNLFNERSFVFVKILSTSCSYIASCANNSNSLSCILSIVFSDSISSIFFCSVLSYSILSCSSLICSNFI